MLLLLTKSGRKISQWRVQCLSCVSDIFAVVKACGCFPLELFRLWTQLLSPWGVLHAVKLKASSVVWATTSVQVFSSFGFFFSVTSLLPVFTLSVGSVMCCDPFSDLLTSIISLNLLNEFGFSLLGTARRERGREREREREGGGGRIWPE